MKILNQSETKKYYVWDGDRPENPNERYVLYKSNEGRYACISQGDEKVFLSGKKKFEVIFYYHIEEIPKPSLTKEEQEKALACGWTPPEDDSELKDGDLVFAWDDDGFNVYGIKIEQGIKFAKEKWTRCLHYKKVTLDEIPEEIRPMIKELM